MKTINMKMTKTEAAEEIANHIRQSVGAMPSTVGIMDNGEIGFRSNVHGLGGMAVIMFDTEGGYGNLGDVSDPDDWTDEDEAAVAQGFMDMWIDEAIERQGEGDDWNDDTVKVVWSN